MTKTTEKGGQFHWYYSVLGYDKTELRLLLVEISFESELLFSHCFAQTIGLLSHFSLIRLI